MSIVVDEKNYFFECRMQRGVCDVRKISKSHRPEQKKGEVEERLNILKISPQNINIFKLEINKINFLYYEY